MIINSLLSLVIASVIAVSAYAPTVPLQVKTVPTNHAVIVDAAGPVTSSDPAQAKAEMEFRKVVLAKERTFYAGDAGHFMSFYADNVVSIQPGMPDIVGKTALAEGITPFLETNHVVGKFILKKVTLSGDYGTRQGEWDETWTANDGSTSFHQIGRCLLVWHKINGEWKVVTEFSNFLVPPTDLAVDAK